MAFDRGDVLFQFELDVRDSTTFTIPMWKTGAMTTTTDASDVLNSIAHEGWRLVDRHEADEADDDDRALHNAKRDIAERHRFVDTP